MAKISSFFKCLICNQVLKFPQDTDIVNFTIDFLSFYRNHERCEQIELSLMKKQQEMQKEEKDPDQPLTT